MQDGNTALHIAVKMSHKEVAELLCYYHLPLDMKNKVSKCMHAHLKLMIIMSINFNRKEIQLFILLQETIILTLLKCCFHMEQTEIWPTKSACQLSYYNAE